MMKFRSDKGKTNQNIVFSTDGTRSCLHTPSAGKKKNQVKRKDPKNPGRRRQKGY